MWNTGRAGSRGLTGLSEAHVITFIRNAQPALLQIAARR
jgi:hypothetical protein